ncbi:Host cell factor 2 [Tulasnella sp. 418]|nr:Host cell factor 2 [Tulasnella sp. 418]
MPSKANKSSQNTPACVRCQELNKTCNRTAPCATCKKIGSHCEYPTTNTRRRSSIRIKRRESEEPSEADRPALKKLRSSTAFSPDLTTTSFSEATDSPLPIPSYSTRVKAELYDSSLHYQAQNGSTSARWSLTPPRKFIVQEIGGDVPYLNSLFTRTVDTSGNNPLMYIFGGSNDFVDGVTNDFYQLDMRNLKWTNITPCLKEVVNVSNPMTRGVESNPLPARDNASAQLYRRDGRSFILLFGGSDKDGNPTNTVLCVEPSCFMWETLHTTAADKNSKSKEILPRSGAGSVVQNDKLFVFGGWTSPREKDNTPLNADSFSVLDLVTLQWIVCDRPYPSQIGSLGFNLDVYAPPCYSGNEVLICRGKLRDGKAVNLSAADMIMFDTNNYRFSFRTEADGDFPSRLNWYDISPHRGSESVCMAYGTLVGRGSGEVPSEAWSFNAEKDEWECLDMANDIWDLDLDLQTLEHVPGKGWCLFGYREVEGREAVSSGNRRGKTRKAKAKSQKPSSIDHSIWNVCVVLEGIDREC